MSANVHGRDVRAWNRNVSISPSLPCFSCLKLLNCIHNFEGLFSCPVPNSWHTQTFTIWTDQGLIKKKINCNLFFYYHSQNSGLCFPSCLALNQLFLSILNIFSAQNIIYFCYNNTNTSRAWSIIMLNTAQMCSEFQPLPWRLCSQMRREIKVQWVEVGHRNSMTRVTGLYKRKMLTNNRCINQS